MNVALSSKARKQLRKLPRTEGLKVARKLQELDQIPFAGKPLTGKLKGLYSLRAWPYRIVYDVDTHRQAVTIHTIEHRQSAYK